MNEKVVLRATSVIEWAPNGLARGPDGREPCAPVTHHGPKVVAHEPSWWSRGMNAALRGTKRASCDPKVTDHAPKVARDGRVMPRSLRTHVIHGTNDDSPKLRVAGAEDGPEVARVFSAAWARMDFVPKLHTPEEDRAFFTKQLEQAHGLVAERGDAIVGFAIHDAHRLRHLYEHPEWQGRGLGAVLLSAVKAALPAGFDLWTFAPNAGARRFYERHGLRDMEQTDGSGNEEGVPDVRYEWRRSGA